MGDTEVIERQILDSADPQALGKLMLKYQDRLLRIVAFRLDRRLNARIDPADVMQDAFVEATQRIDDYRASADQVSFFLWLRFLTLQKVTQLHRHHLGVQARDANRDVPIFNRASPQATSVVLAAQLLGDLTSPSGAAIREENRRRLEDALSRMEGVDREVLALRHFEHLTNGETAKLLGLSDSAACNRYFRAVRRLKSTMDQMGQDAGVFEEP